MNNPRNNFFKKKVFVLTIIFLLGFFLFPVKSRAQDVIGGPTTVIRKITDFIQDKLVEQLKKVGSLAFQSTLQSVLNTIAYDAANYIATGDKGQKPLFSREYLTDLGEKARDAAVGQFIDELSKEWQVDLCRPPNIDIELSIGLGLVAFNQPEFYKPRCDWQEMRSNWASEYDRWKSMQEPDFLNKVSNMFDPTGNDVTLALEMFGRSQDIGAKQQEKIEEQLKMNSGWLDIRDIGGKTESVPGDPQRKLQRAESAQTQNLAQFTGDALIDATNIFLNQLYIATWDNFIKTLGKKIPDDSEDAHKTASTDPSTFSGQSYIVESLKKVIKPRFNVRADYNVLSDLMICLDANNPGPNNCIIDNQFSQAIQNKNTVIEAINNGYLNPNWTFDNGSDYQSGFNLRSLMVLRKFRIIPLGWEEALVRAEEKTTQTGYRYTLMDMVSCFNPNDEYEVFSQGFLKSNFSNHSWCEGLVDPTWVLKTPLNYCKRQGYGGYVMSKQLINIPDVAYGQADISPIIVSRSDNYCADEQSCIKERSDGTCEIYGYCVEEKRAWNFGEDSCDPVYNTCDSFTSASSGKKLALLQNTIDYSVCNADNVGCSQYAVSGVYSTSTSKITWNNFPLIYFNNKAESCAASAEGCQEFIRTTSGGGHNFLINGDFESNLNIGGWSGLATTSISYSGDLAVEIFSPLTRDIVVAPSNYVVAGESYNLSFYSYCFGSATSTVSLGVKNQDIIKGDDFVYQAINYTYSNNYSSNAVSFTIYPNGNTCIIDNIKLERGSVGTFYSNYRGNGLIYEKTIPDYLKNLCYQNPLATVPDYRLKEDAPNECYKYARLCNNNEVGCDLFTSAYGIKVAAKALDKDYCPSQCVGYDVYVQKNTLFENKAINKFIPASARTCGLSDVGCTEFTNIDELAAGGEGMEYYSYLRHCIKPEQGVCENFYTWEGNDESGYQLKSFNLEKENANIRPKITEGVFDVVAGRSVHRIGSDIVCDPDIHALPASDPGYNPDCREFYNQQGEIVYVLYTKTITCSNNCKTYRMTEKNVNIDISTPSACSALNTLGNIVANWDASTNSCYHCLSGGRWDNTQQACLYQAVPGEGSPCQAANNNCREYNGNSGNNVRIISSFDFNLGLGNWSGQATSSMESLSQGGKSMRLFGTANTIVGDLVKQGSAYVVKFLVKNNQNKNLSIYFTNDSQQSLFGVSGDAPTSYSVNIPASSEWRLYQVNLENLNHSISDDEKLVLSFAGSGEVYISSIVLIEITDRYYLIKDSWETPNICYYDTFNNYRGVNYNLGCQNYTDRSNRIHALRQFTGLCDNSAIGCEMMVKTNNYNSFNPAIFNDHNNNGTCDSSEPDCVFIPGDKFVPVVYDSTKLCNAVNKGCSRVGKLILSNIAITAQNIYKDVYLKNDPNKYDSTLCQEDELGCDAWKSGTISGTSYFKDPGDSICQWRKGSDINSGFAWYKKAVKKCAVGNVFTNNICLTDDDCLLGQTCKTDTTDYLCPIETMKTIGYGGSSPIYQPGEEFGIKWAGLCPIKQAGCTEYIDPISSFSPNIILNPNFSDLDGDGNGFDLWTPLTPSNCSVVSGIIACSQAGGAIRYEQPLQNLISNKLYILKTNGNQEAILTCSQPVYRLVGENTVIGGVNVDSNNFAPGVNTLTAIPAVQDKIIFYSGLNNDQTCKIEYNKSAGINFGATFSRFDSLKNKISNSNIPFVNKLFNIKSVDAQNDDFSIEIKEVVIDYQLKQDLDSSGCQAQANFNNGCILFNERSFTGSDGLTVLNYNASNYSNYSPCSGDDCDANKLLKVKPDRVCGKWLSCYAYSIDPSTNEKICLEMGECTSFNYDGSCFNFSKAPDGIRQYTPGRDDNATGYSVLGMDYLANMRQVGSDGPFSDDFEIESTSVNSWERYNGTAIQTFSTSSCLINKPNHVAIFNKKVSYPASGLGFLKVGKDDCGKGNGDYLITQSSISLVNNSDYYLNFMINTEDLSFGEKAIIKIVGIDDSNNIIWSGSDDPYVFDFENKNGWREVSQKFVVKPSWLGGVKIILESPGNNPFYLDDIRIEPVLEVVKSTINGSFIPATCRLYPTQDSLLCESENKNFIANGWYGYCLQKDPKNLDVCLLWYPVDAIKGGKGASAASSAFIGYPSTGGAQPYYCAEMSANFDLVELRESYVQMDGTSRYFWRSNSDNINLVFASGAPRCMISDGIPTSKFDPFYVFAGNWKSSDYAAQYTQCLLNSNCIPGFDCQDESSSNNESCNPWDTDDGALRGCFGQSSDQNSGSRYAFYFCQPKDLPDKIITNNNKVFSKDSYMRISMGVGSDKFCRWGVSPSGDNLELSSGWYKYTGQGNSGNVSVLAYDYADQNTCQNTFSGTFYSCSSPSIACPSGVINACLISVNNYIPKCSKIVRGNIPWVDRVNNSNKSIGDYVNANSSLSAPSILNEYKLGSPGSPFGAIITNNPISSNSLVLAGSSPNTEIPYGLPYSCNSYGREVYINGSNINSCAALHFSSSSNKKVYLSHTIVSPLSYTHLRRDISNFGKYEDTLRHIWLKVSRIDNNSGHSGYDCTHDSSPCNNPISFSLIPPRNPEEKYEAIIPQIPEVAGRRVRLFSSLGTEVIPSANQTFTIGSPGFYTISFNSIIDKEQTPISKMTVRIKEDNQAWDSNVGVLTFNKLDPMPDPTNPHRIIKYLPQGNYKILVKVEDNWKYFRCVGLNGFNTSVANCDHCCQNNFVTPTPACSNCP